MNWVFVDIDQTIADTDWSRVDLTQSVSDDKTVEIHQDADGILPMLQLMYNLKSPIIFITNRYAKFKSETQAWLKRNHLHSACIFRPADEVLAHGNFKAKYIKALQSPGDTVVVIDDDANGSMETACRENGWVHLKVTTYPKRVVT